MAEASAADFRLLASNLNLPRKQAAFWGIDDYRQYLEATKADGFELTPLNSRITWSKGSLNGVVYSLHQPFRRSTTGEIIQRGPLKKIPGSLAMAAVVGRPDTSFEPLQRLQQRIGHKVTAVVYPNQQVTKEADAWATARRPINYKAWKGEFKHLAWQPTAEALQREGLLKNEPSLAVRGIRAFRDRTGIGKVVFDGYHWQSERVGHRMPPWEETLPTLLQEGDCIEAHLSPARPDMGGEVDDLNIVLRGGIARTEMGDMLACIYENTPAGTEFPVVLEMPHAAIATAGLKDYIAIHRDLFAAMGTELRRSM